MIGVVLVTHGRLAEEFKSAVEHVVGPQSHFETVCIGPEDDMEARRQDIVESAKKVDMGDGVILLTDMFGGTPSNLAISMLDQDKIEVIAGVNLPMLIKIATLRGAKALPEVIHEAQEAGRKYINVASNLLSDGS
jgi:PTS system mannose-specific IIA component